MKLRKKIKILFTKSEEKKLRLIFLGILIMAILEVIGVASIMPFITLISTPGVIHNNVYFNTIYIFLGVDDTYFIILSGILVIVTLLISNGVKAFITWKLTHFSNMQVHRLSMKLLRQYLLQPYSFYINKNTSELGKNILSEVDRGVGGVIMQSMVVASKIVVALFLFGFLLFLNPLIAITALIVLGGFYFLIFSLFKKKIHAIGVEQTELTYKRYKISNEAMSGIKEVKIHNKEEEFVNKFATSSERYANNGALSQIISIMPHFFLEVIVFGGMIAITISIFNTIPDGNSVIPIISIYAMVGYRMMPSLQQIYSGITTIKYNTPALQILINDLSQKIIESKGDCDKKPTIKFNKKIQIKDLIFNYPNSTTPTIKKLNLSIDCNTTVGLVGSTGSGKTTLVDILLGLLSPNAGDIIVDGVQISENNISSWQRKLGYVPQTIYLMDDTIENNISFSVSKGKTDRDRVIKATKMANLDHFISTLPEQYQTVVGERGVRLSGGQRQRIGIARALYNNPELLVLDEATSALDGVTENVIMDTIHNITHKKTIIIIAHRLSTVKACDVIHMLKDGRIVESGTFSQLTSSNKEFRRMAYTSKL
jgi:ABC-type multidrug transport system fused ATPase/permease subunit